MTKTPDKPPIRTAREWRELGYDIPDYVPDAHRIRVVLDATSGVLWMERAAPGET